MFLFEIFILLVYKILDICAAWNIVFLIEFLSFYREGGASWATSTVALKPDVQGIQHFFWIVD